MMRSLQISNIRVASRPGARPHFALRPELTIKISCTLAHTLLRSYHHVLVRQASCVLNMLEPLRPVGC